MEGNERQSFVMYASFLEAAEGLDGEAFKECVLKLRDFALYGEDVSSKDPVINIILTMAKPNLNAAAARYQRCVENGSKGKEHGAKGGRPRKGETLEAYEARRRKPETPRKPLDDEDDEKENEKENNDVDVKLIQSPAATEPARGSGRDFGISSSISFESIYGPKGTSSVTPDDIWMIRQHHADLSNSELAARYEEDLYKISQSRANGGKYRHEALLAVEAAMIAQRRRNLPTLDEAKRLVVQDINQDVQRIQTERSRLIRKPIATPDDDDESDQPF